MAKKVTLTVLYKSGNKIRIKVENMTVTRTASGDLSVAWEGLEPHPLLFGVDDVEAIWEGKV